MTEITCIFTKLDEPLVYNKSIKQSEIEKIPCEITLI